MLVPDDVCMVTLDDPTALTVPLKGRAAGPRPQAVCGAELPGATVVGVDDEVGVDDVATVVVLLLAAPAVAATEAIPPAIAPTASSPATATPFLALLRRVALAWMSVSNSVIAPRFN